MSIFKLQLQNNQLNANTTTILQQQPGEKSLNLFYRHPT